MNAYVSWGMEQYTYKYYTSIQSAGAQAWRHYLTAVHFTENVQKTLVTAPLSLAPSPE